MNTPKTWLGGLAAVSCRARRLKGINGVSLHCQR